MARIRKGRRPRGNTGPFLFHICIAQDRGDMIPTPVQDLGNPMTLSGAIAALEPPRGSGPATESRKSSSARIGELDALRGIAALAVVFHHLTSRFFEDYGTPPGAAPAFPFRGVEGVFLFFIISGFVISQTLERIRRARDFVVSRFSRIFPSFWVCVLLTYGAVLAFGLPGREVRFGAFLVNLTMLQ